EAPLKKIDKYISRIKKDYPMVGLAAVFYMGGSETVKEIGLNVSNQFAELAYKMVVLDLSVEEVQQKNQCDTY
ncbi:hypothetical protein B8W92_11660, partial [Moraxella osloensis]